MDGRVRSESIGPRHTIVVKAPPAQVRTSAIDRVRIPERRRARPQDEAAGSSGSCVAAPCGVYEEEGGV